MRGIMHCMLVYKIPCITHQTCTSHTHRHSPKDVVSLLHYRGRLAAMMEQQAPSRNVCSHVLHVCEQKPCITHQTCTSPTQALHKASHTPRTTNRCCFFVWLPMQKQWLETLLLWANAKPQHPFVLGVGQRPTSHCRNGLSESKARHCSL